MWVFLIALSLPTQLATALTSFITHAILPYIALPKY